MNEGNEAFVNVELNIRSKSGSGTVVQKVKGVRYERNGKLYYQYKEPESEMGQVTAILRVEPESIRLLRQGDVRSEQQFRKGKRMPGFYDTAMGRLELDTETRELRIQLEKGIGRMNWSYDLYVSGEYAGRYKLDVEIKELPD